VAAPAADLTIVDDMRARLEAFLNNVLGRLGNVGSRMDARRLGFLLLVLSAAYYLCYAEYGVDLDDEGLLLEHSANVLSGQWPIADLFPSYSPGMYWGLAVFFNLFDTTIMVERFYLILILVVCGQLIYYIARQFLSPTVALIPSLTFALAPGPWYKIFFHFALLLPVAGLFNWLRRETGLAAFIGGLGAGAAFVIRWEAAALVVFLALGSFCLHVVMAVTRGKPLHVSLIGAAGRGLCGGR
jgi:hypothetical protein